MYVDKPLVGREGCADPLPPQPGAPQESTTPSCWTSPTTPTQSRTGFSPYYRTTILSEETDPDRLHDLKAALDGYQVYDPVQIDELVERYLSGAERDRLDPILDRCVAAYREQLDEGGQVDFKGKAKAFLRAYGFLAAFLPYTHAEWEKLSIFLTFLVPQAARSRRG